MLSPLSMVNPLSIKISQVIASIHCDICTGKDLSTRLNVYLCTFCYDGFKKAIAMKNYETDREGVLFPHQVGRKESGDD